MPQGARAVGLSGIDGGLLEATRRPPREMINEDTGEKTTVDFGHVGDVTGADTSLLSLLVENGYVPVVGSLCSDEAGNILNINADTVASVLARGLGATRLLSLTSVPGVLRNADDPESLISTLTVSEVDEAIRTGVVKGGMVPKVTALVDAVRGGVRGAAILSGLAESSLLLELFTSEGVGTLIRPDAVGFGGHGMTLRDKQDGLLRGRFKGGVHPALDKINRSYDVDQRMWAEDIRGSMAHARMLGERGILRKTAVKQILYGLRKIEKEFEAGSFKPRPEDEDIHMAVERRLTELIGADGARLHAGRSRNDQVATDLRLYLIGLSGRVQERLRDVQRALVALGDRDGLHLMPFYTHLQRAQPVLLGHALLAYVEMLGQDERGILYVPRECPLGSGAGAGTSFPIDRKQTAKELGFKAPSPNSLEAVSSRRDVAFMAAGLAGIATTLSRLGADIVLWTSREFGFARLGDTVSTGSSIMPQKRNPDGAELLRAAATRVTAAMTRLFEVQRGLGIGYHKDLQEDKSALFEAEDTVLEMLDVADAMLGDISFDADRMRDAVSEPDGYLLATELADYLVRQHVPFREAHEAVGKLVQAAGARTGRARGSL